MTKNPPDIYCPCPTRQEQCHDRTGSAGQGTPSPLSAVCGRERYRVCRINGDRGTCARMAQLGVLPGAEIELVCPGQAKQCQIRIMGGTVTLDQISAESILVTPA